MTSIRAYHYARCAAILNSDHSVPGAAAVFDQGLSNGLAAIVERAWTGHEWKRQAFLKSATELLDVVATMAEAVGGGVYCIRLDPNHLPVGYWELRGNDPEALLVRVDVRTLKDGVARTQAARHGRGGSGGVLDRSHVKALLALDEDPALDCAWVESLDSDRSRMVARDAERMTDAQRYLELIGDVEAERRASVIDNRTFISERSCHQPCPVCGYQTLLVAGTDSWGMDVGHGTCLTCSYHRTEEIAEADAEGMLLYSAEAPHTTPEA